MTERRFLVLGCGSIGRRHAANLRALEAGAIAVWDPDAARAHALAREIDATVATGPDETADVVVIAAPTSEHLALASTAAERGSHLFIEKPLGHEMRGVDEFLAVVKECGLITLVGCNMRFHPGVARTKALVDAGVAGRVVSIRVEAGYWLPLWHPNEDYRQGYSAKTALGGGVILDAIHEIDIARWMLGEVEAVACFAGHLTPLEIDTEDVAAILLRFAGGPIAEVHLDYVQRAYSRSCRLIGEEGAITLDWASGEVRWFATRRGEWIVERVMEGWEINDMYLAQTRHLLRALDGEEPPALDVFEAARVLEVALAAKESARTGAVVRL